MIKTMRSRLFFPLVSALACVPFIIGYSANDNVYTPFIENSLGMEKSFILFFGVLALLITLSKYITSDKRAKMISLCLGVFFACCVVFGKSYESIASWGYVFSSYSAFFASLLSIAGYAIIFYYIMGALFSFIFSYDDILSKNTGFLSRLNGWRGNFFEKRSLLVFWAVLFLCWLPYAIINYPGVIHADSGVMLEEYFSGTLYNHHPVLQTIVWGGFVQFGHDVLGSYNAGVFLFVLVQLLYGSLIVALLFDYVYKKGYPFAIIVVSLLVVALMPAFPRNATAVCKDSNYTFFVLLMIWLVFKTFDSREDTLKKKWYLLPLWVFTILLICFSRKTGIYLVLPMVFFVLLYTMFFNSSVTLRKNKANTHDNKRHVYYAAKNIKITAVLALSAVLGIGLYFGGEYVIANVYNIGNNDTQESYSIPFQQTARYVREYGGEVTDEEREAIDAVLDYDGLAEAYNPELSNPVKSTFRRDSTKEDFKRYLGVWFRQFLKHPAVYVQATLNGIYGYFYPDNVGYYKDLFFMTNAVDGDKIDYPSGLAYALRDVNMQSRNIPVLGVFSSLGFFIWADIFIMLFFIFFKKDKKFLIYNIPAVLTILICVASPVNNTMRYGLPVMFMAPVLFCMCFNRGEMREDRRQRE